MKSNVYKKKKRKKENSVLLISVQRNILEVIGRITLATQNMPEM